MSGLEWKREYALSVKSISFLQLSNFFGIYQGWNDLVQRAAAYCKWPHRIWRVIDTVPQWLGHSHPIPQHLSYATQKNPSVTEWKSDSDLLTLPAIVWSEVWKWLLSGQTKQNLSHPHSNQTICIAPSVLSYFTSPLQKPPKKENKHCTPHTMDEEEESLF